MKLIGSKRINFWIEDYAFDISGRITPVDANGDGYTELFVPSYYEDNLYVYTYEP